MMHLNPAVHPFNNLRVVVSQHFGELIEELGDGMMLSIAIKFYISRLRVIISFVVVDGIIGIHVVVISDVLHKHGKEQGEMTC